MKLSKQRALHGAALITDPRFARLHFDPRFQRPAKRKLKIPIDSRFGHMFSDKRFADPLSVDKRGRPIKNAKRRHSLRQYYHVHEDLDNEAAQDVRQPALLVCGDNSIDHEQDGPSQHGSMSQQKGSSISHTNDHSSSGPNAYSGSTDVERGHRTETVITNKSDHRLNQDLISEKTKINSERRESHGPGGLPSAKDERHWYSEDSDLFEDSDGLDSSTDSPESTSRFSSQESSSEDDEEEELDASPEEREGEEVAVIDKETRRLALINMDWDHIRAVDILVVMTSFLPKGGQILSVSVYPSEFGLQQIKEEEKQGPKILFESKGHEEDNEEATDGMDMEKLRQYEKAKLRYFYAVIECDSCATSDFLYKSCDGMEFERTSNILDLRFIPDEMKLELSPQDVATDVPSDYQPPMFETRALQHSTVKLTWDDDEPARLKTLHQKFNSKQMNEMDFNVYVASDNSDNSDVEDADHSDRDHNFDGTNLCVNEDEKMPKQINENRSVNNNAKESARNLYRALLLGPDKSSESKEAGKMNEDMEITFHTGLDELSKRLMNRKKQQDDETVWEAYLRTKKENKKARKSLRHAEEEDYESMDDHQSDDPFFSNDVLDFEDPFFKSEDKTPLNDESSKSKIMDSKTTDQSKAMLKSSKKGKVKDRSEIEQKKLEEQKNRAELELLLADERVPDNAVKGYNLKKRLSSKLRRIEELPHKVPTVNYDDPRFAALFTSHRFAIDSTEAEYRRSAAQLRPLLEQQQKHFSRGDEVSSQKTDDSAVQASKKTNHQLSLMVRSLKRKVGGHG